MTTHLLEAVHADVRPLGEARCLVTTPQGEMYELEAPAETIAGLLARCDGQKDQEAVLQGLENKKDLSEVLSILGEEGCIRSTSDAPIARMDLYLVGDQTLCGWAEELSSGWRSVHRVEGDDLPTPADPTAALIVSLLPHMDEGRLVRLNRHAAELGCRWTQFHVDLGKAYLGPFIIPGETSDYEDLVGRRKCSGDDVEGARMQPPTVVTQAQPAAAQAALAMKTRRCVALLFAQIENVIAAQTNHLLSTELEVDLDTLAHIPHPILPLPTRAPKTWRCSVKDAYQQVVGSRCGLVLSQHIVGHHPTSMPSNLLTVRSHCTDLSRIYPWGNDLFVGGSTFGDEPSARGASLGEALERYCGNCLPGVEMIKGSYKELVSRGHNVLDPERMILHSDKMTSEPGCPFVPFTQDVAVYWTHGRSLTHDKDCLLPLSLVYANWYGGDLDQPNTNYLYTPGMAAGQNLERALVGAIRELVERDITMVWWLNALELPAVKPTPALEALWNDVPEAKYQKVRYIHLDNPFNIPVIVAVVAHTGLNLLNIGFGCRPDPEQAARKALTEALTLQEGSRDLLEEDSTLRRSSEEWNLLSVPYKPHRSDRTYMDAFRPDFRDINDLMLQQQFYLDPRAVEKVRTLVDPPVTRTFDQLPRLEDDRFETYRKPIEAAGFEILYADITSPDVALTPFRVVRAMIPGLVPNMPAAFPAVGGARVFDLPVEMGLREAPLSEEALNYFPMPHA